jgi:LCP family protein required for cell wall assembly
MLLIILGVILIAAGFVVSRAWATLDAVANGGGTTEPIAGRYNIALLGSDSADWRDDARIDSITVASVDAVTGRTLLISTSRSLTAFPFPATSPLHQLYPDGYVCPDQERQPCMLTTIYQLGLDHADLYPGSADPGAEAMVDAIEGITGLTMNYYALIDMDGFEGLIDALGGIDITVNQRVPIGAVGITDYWIEPGSHHFSGPEALWYVRSRIDTDDAARTIRQRCVMLAMLNQVDPGTIASHFFDLMNAASDVAQSNVPISAVAGLADLAAKATRWTVTTMTISPTASPTGQESYTFITAEVAAAVAAAEARDDGASSPADLTQDLTTICGY